MSKYTQIGNTRFEGGRGKRKGEMGERRRGEREDWVREREGEGDEREGGEEGWG